MKTSEDESFYIDDLIKEVNESNDSEQRSLVPASMENEVEEVSTDRGVAKTTPQEAVSPSNEELINSLLEMTKEDRDQASNVVNMFYDKINLGKDYSPSSKENLVRAIEAKINASKNIVDLLKIKLKREEDRSHGNSFAVINAVNGTTESVDFELLMKNV